MEINEQIIKLKGNEEIYLQDDVLYVSVKGDMDKEKALKNKNDCLELMQHKIGKVDVIIDLNNAGKQTIEAREIWKELSNDSKTGRIAFVGISSVSRVLATFFIGLSGKKNMNFFKSCAEALFWIKKNNN